MNQRPTREHKENVIVFPGADLPPQSNIPIYREIKEREISIGTLLAASFSMSVLALFAFYGFIALLTY